MWRIFEESPVEDATMTNAFSSRGFFRISSDEKVQHYPRVQAMVQNKKMAMALDKSLVLLEDDSVAECAYVSFNAQIDVMQISPSGNLIVCGLNNGEVHGIYIKGLALFSLNIKGDDVHMTCRSFAAIQQLGKSFYLSCTNGQVYYLSEIDEAVLESKLQVSDSGNDTIPFDEHYFDAITLQRLPMGLNLSDITASVLIGRGDQSPPVSIAGSHHTVFIRSSPEDTTKLIIAEHYEGIKKMYNLDSYILILTSSGHLLEVCPVTKTIMMPQSIEATVMIDDLVILDCTDDNIELLLLTKPDADGHRLMKFVDFPSFKCNNELEVARESWLVAQPKCSLNLYYLNGLQLNEENLPTTVEMTVVSETHPSERFRKLIAKGHLKEAEEFGREFELCLQPIYHAKAKRILMQLATLSDNNPELLTQSFEELLQQFDLIESKDFFTANRMVRLDSRKLLGKYLREMLCHLDEEVDEAHVMEINEQLLRLETLSIIDPYECNTEWQEFVYKPSLSGTILSLLKTDIPTACLLWKRHSSSIMPEIDEHKLAVVLAHIPNNTEAFHLLQWLRQFIPTVSGTHPNMMPMITEWSIQKTRALQFNVDWPEIGLEFSTKVMDIYEDLQFIHSDVRRQHDRNIAKLRDLVNALQDLSVLKKSYNLIFTLDNYLKDSIDETALCILQRVQLCNLKSLVNDFLRPIFQEKGQTPVQAIRSYITLLVTNRNALSTWLERATACIEHLHNEDDRMECALMVLQHSPVPWPDSVAPLVKLRFSTHPLAVKISSEYELQVIKMMKAKYGWPTDNAAGMDLRLFMLRIVKMDLPDMLDDIRILTKAAPDVALAANFNCCHQLVLRGKIEVAYDFFKELNAKKDTKPAVVLIEMFADMLENRPFATDEKSTQKLANLLEFFKLLVPHGEEASLRKRLRAIQNRHTLRHKFGLQVRDVRALVSLEARLAYFDTALGTIIERSHAAKNVSKFIISELNELCNALDMGKLFGIHRISRRMRCLPLTCLLAYSMVECCDCSADNAKDYVDLALELVAQQIEWLNKNKDAFKCSTLLLNEHDALAFPLAFDILCRASSFCKDELAHLVELTNYIQIAASAYPLNAVQQSYCGNEREVNEIICRALGALDGTSADQPNASIDPHKGQTPRKPKGRESISMFDDVELKPSSQPTNKLNGTDQMSIVRFVAHALHLLATEEQPANPYFGKLRHLLEGREVCQDGDSLRGQFFSSLEHLIKGKVHEVWYVMAQSLLEYQRHSQSKIINADFVSLQLSRVFRNVIAHKDVNFIDLFVMLIADAHHEILLKKLGNELKTDQQRMNYLTLCEMYSVHNDDLDRVDVIRSKRLKYFYYLEFCQQNPSIRGKFNADSDPIEKLLREFHNKQLDVHLLERMSRDFHLDYQQVLVTQILSILHGQEMHYEVTTNSLGEEELVMLSSSEQIRSMCQPYINELKNTEMLASKLKHFIGEINMYFYEMYLCVIEILGFLDAMPKEMQIWMSILQFLKHKMVTRRRQRPGQLETDMWYQSQTEIGVLPKIARYRFPFKPLVEQPLKDILESELNVANCESWFPLIQMHSLLKGTKDIGNVCDAYCMAAVKNSINEYKSKNDSEPWHMQPTNNSFLQSVIRLTRHVRSVSKAFMIFYFVSNYAPDGADQVEAAYECYKYAVEHESEITEPKYQEYLAKIKRKYPILKTQHLLNIFGLTDEKLMHLVENPQELIYSLYHHDLVVKSSKLDINTVVNEIAELHNLELERLQYHLLQTWLAFNAESADGTVMDETFFEDQQMVPANGAVDGDNACDNVVRASYILSNWNKITAIQFLIARIFENEGTLNTSKQLQMYECFSKLNDGSVTFHGAMINQTQYITIKCVHELKRLGYNSSVEKFASCNKMDILKTIWQRNAQNPVALEILANICLGFDIYVTKIWNGILKRMTMFNMVRELNALVDLLSCKPKLLHTEGLKVAWECVLMHPFKHANQTRSFEQEEILNKTLCRLQSCPVVRKLNLLEFAEHCNRLDRPHMAAMLLALCDNPEECEKIKKIILQRKSEKMRDDILDLKEAGILPTLLNYALKELDL